MNRGWQANFFWSPQTANPEILVLIPLPQIRKFLRRAHPQIESSEIFMNNLRITNMQSSSESQLCKPFFLYEFELEYFMLYLYVWRKRMYMRTCRSINSAKKLVSANPQITNPQITKRKRDIGRGTDCSGIFYHVSHHHRLYWTVVRYVAALFICLQKNSTSLVSTAGNKGQTISVFIGNFKSHSPYLAKTQNTTAY